MKEIFPFDCLRILLFLLVLVCCFEVGRSQSSLSPKDLVLSKKANRKLYKYLYNSTLKREAFSPIKNEKLDLSIKKEIKKYKKELIQANTLFELYYAIAKISNARKDAHLLARPLKEGISFQYLSEQSPFQKSLNTIPVKFEADFTQSGSYFLFVAERTLFPVDPILETGDKVAEINGQSANDYFQRLIPYLNYSTQKGLWAIIPRCLEVRTPLIGPEIYKDSLYLKMEKPDGKQYNITLPYVDRKGLKWEDKFPYKGFSEILDLPSFKVYSPLSGSKVVLIQIKGFKRNLDKDINVLMDYAVENNCLNHSLILDATKSEGGARGVGLLRHLTAKRFKPTFGNLRLSDIIPFFIQQKSQLHQENEEKKALLNWLNGPVSQDLKKGKPYTRNVPFKMQFVNKMKQDSLLPHPLHFKGALVALFSPASGSQIDQLAAMIVDNSLGLTLGMPCGGYSNTWEWEEVLHYPDTNIPLVGYSWSIGQTIRPNGEVLEGNPADVDQFIPVTRDNYQNYRDLLVRRALEAIDQY